MSLRHSARLSPAERAVRQQEAAGKTIRPGQRVRFVFTLGKPGVHAWNVPVKPDPRMLDLKRYRVLFERAVNTVLDPIQLFVAGGKVEQDQFALPMRIARPLKERGDGWPGNLGEDHSLAISSRSLSPSVHA